MKIEFCVMSMVAIYSWSSQAMEPRPLPKWQPALGTLAEEDEKDDEENMSDLNVQETTSQIDNRVDIIAQRDGYIWLADMEMYYNPLSQHYTTVDAIKKTFFG